MPGCDGAGSGRGRRDGSLRTTPGDSGQGLRLWPRLCAQLPGQDRPEGLVGVERPGAVPGGELRLHQAPVGFLAQGGVPRPAGGGGDDLTDLAVFQLGLAEALANQVHAAMPGFALRVYPQVEVWRIVQRKAFEEIAAICLGTGPEPGEQLKTCIVIEPRTITNRGLPRLTVTVE